MYGLAVDNWSSMVASPHVIGDHLVVLTALNNLPTLPGGRVYRFTAGLNLGQQSESILGIFEATGLSGSTLSGVTASAGYADVALAAGVQVQIRVCKATIAELQDDLDALGTMADQDDDAVAITGGSLGGFTLVNHVQPFRVATDGSTVTLNCALNDRHLVTIAASRTLALANAQDGQQITVAIKQGGSGSNLVTWFGNLKWVGGTVPTLTTVAGKVDLFTFLRMSSTEYWGFVVGQNI